MSNHPAVLYASLERVGPTRDGQRLVGLFLPAQQDVRAEVRLGGTALAVEWRLASPALADRFPDVPGSAAARFRATHPPELSGQARLLVHDEEGAVHEVATCEIPALPGTGRRIPVPAVRARLEELATGAPPADGEQVRLLRSLAGTPVPERGTDWLEALVLLQVVFRTQPRNAFTNLEALRDARGEAGAERFGDFLRRCRQLLHPDTLTPHGFEAGLAVRDPDRLWAEVRDVCSAVRELGAKPFLAAGTLLGLIRDGRPIPYDYDADLIVVVPGNGPSQAVAGLWDLKERLAGMGLLSEEYEQEGHHHARVISPSGLPVDLFPAWVDDADRLHAWPTVPGTLSAAALLPGATRTVAGVELPVPQDPEAILVANYGEGWRHPDPTFRFPWAEARAEFQEYVGASRARQQSSRWGATGSDG